MSFELIDAFNSSHRITFPMMCLDTRLDPYMVYAHVYSTCNHDVTRYLPRQLYTSSCIGFAPSRNLKSEHAARIFPSAPPSPSLSLRSSSSGSMDMAVAPPSVHKTTSTAEVGREWGHVSNLHGLISSVCLFADAVSANAIKILHKRGTHYLYLVPVRSYILYLVKIIRIACTVYVLIYRTVKNNYFGNCPGIIRTDFYRACEVSGIIRTSKQLHAS